MLHVEAVKAFNDNYLWVLHAPGSTQAAVVDPGDARPVLAYLEKAGLQLAAILVTHHHADHIGGIADLLAHTSVPVYGPANARIPQVTRIVAEGDVLEILGHKFQVLEVPGHTLEHIAYFMGEATFTDPPLVFCGDTLFAAGCGRMFEGTPPMMHASLQKLAALPPATRVYCAHEYTLSNLRFAQAVMPSNPDVASRITTETAKRARAIPTVPTTIGLELRTNPFLRCEDPDVLAAVACQGPHDARDPANVFGTLRQWKDSF